MGALAGHVAWEHRVTAVRDHEPDVGPHSGGGV